jgi:hypothetical protein
LEGDTLRKYQKVEDVNRGVRDSVENLVRERILGRKIYYYQYVFETEP